MAPFSSRPGRISIAAVAAAIALGVSGLAAPAALAADAAVNIDILSFNDFHGRLEAATPAAGAAVLGGMVDSYRAANPNTLVVSGGDSVGASTFTSFIQNDQPTIDALNQIGVDASAVGNHELDKGQADLTDRIIPATNYPLLSANIYDKTIGQPAFDQYALKQVGGVTVGFIGATTDETPSLVSPAGVANLEFRDITTEVNKVADQLSDGNQANGEADVIVLTVHEGAADATLAAATGDSAFGKIVNGLDANVDAIVSGHTHQAYNHEIAIPGTDRTRPVLQAGKYGENYGHIALSVDPTSHALLSISSEVKPLFGAFAPDPAVAQIVAAAVAAAKDKGSAPVGTITADFNRASQADGITENRGGESTLGNFVADVQQWAAKDGGAQIALMNPGGLRTDLKYAASATTPNDIDGRVTYQEAASVQPFANTLVTETLTGAQLKQLLEEQWQPAAATRPFLKLGVSEALKYSYDPSAAVGSHITAVYVDGTLVQPTDNYKVVVNSFLASGGDNFFTLAKGTNAGDTGKIDLQSMVDYFVANPTASPNYKQRAVGVKVSAPDADGYSAGDTVTLDLSSLLFSNGEPNTRTAVVSAGGTELGSAVIDPAIVNLTDEVGRASVSVTVPDGTPAGTLKLNVSVPSTGTSIDVPIEVTVPAKPITTVTQPTITGKARVGGTLSTDGGKWSVDNPSLSYQWSRNGTAIEGATSAKYALVPADAGASVTVTVTAKADGFTDGTATSAAVMVSKLSSSIFASPDRILVSHRAPVTYTVRVDGNGVPPTGDVVIYDGRKVLATATLTATDNGRITVTVPPLSRGLHFPIATFGGNGQLKNSVSWPSVLLVY
ncbi:5'-nucleotidase C-terminal domain-containing protein [Glaciihabitans sp. UYNi722]|uniref:5'-nucleotidase C-terminal domain-containing protein n=1 Tax=Glaciihabitans sp. UYNi722 TaxID=3156344 RepID=UPI003397F051